MPHLKLEKLAQETGAKVRASTLAVAIMNADALLFDVRWSRMDDVLKQAGELAGSEQEHS